MAAEELWVVEYVANPKLGIVREQAPSAAEARRVAANLRNQGWKATAYAFDPQEVTKLGVLQRAVLVAIRDHGDPVPPGTSYDRRCRLEEVARKMKQRGFFHRLPWNHPDVIRGGRDCFLTPLGAAAVAVLDAPAPRRVRPATGKRRP